MFSLSKKDDQMKVAQDAVKDIKKNEISALYKVIYMAAEEEYPNDKNSLETLLRECFENSLK